MVKPIGLLGGTFDPIHFGHLRTALECQSALNLAEVRLIPCFQPVHRTAPVASPEERLAMVKCAIQNEPALTVEACEIRRASPSWTIDTLETLRRDLPDTPLCLIMGIDVLSAFPQWRRFAEIPTLAHLIIAHRPNCHLPDNPEINALLSERMVKSPAALHEAKAGKILFHPVTPLEISATDIRRQIAAGLNPRYLLPDSVCDYIRQQGIYKNFDGNTQ